VFDTERVVEAVARGSYGRLLSYLAARSGDVASAEDALADAFLAALRSWPQDGVPNKPEAWLLQAARRRLIDRARLSRTAETRAEPLREILAEADSMTALDAFPDERLKLLFVCAHPAIDSRVHTPLMLQVVLGLDAAAIAEAFVTPASTIGQRLSRAKAKIKSTRIAFSVPEGAELQRRLPAVLEAIYAAYARGWDDVGGADAERRGLIDESVWLARLLTELLPSEPEALGLLALLEYCEARRPARKSQLGDYVPISSQDPGLWAHQHLIRAAAALAAAAAQRRAGRFQLEAAIQAAHVERARTGRTDWSAIALLYEGLIRIAPTIGALLGRAAAVAEAQGARVGFALLEALPGAELDAHQPYHALRAHLEERLGQRAAAAASYARALALTHDPAVRRFLEIAHQRVCVTN